MSAVTAADLTARATSTVASVTTRVAEVKHSAPVTHWDQRIWWTVGCIVVVIGVYALMRAGWRRRGRHQSHLAPLPAVPTTLGEALAGPVEGVYVSSTTEGDWLDRVVAHGLGTRSGAAVSVHPEGVLFARDGAADVFVPTGRLRAVGRAPGMAGKYVGNDGLLVVTWELGATDDAPEGVRTGIDTGFRARSPEEHDDLEDAIHHLLQGVPQ
jgi:hypothetical protein